jgi:outer membrane protein OmpA-like peptidoglycan-associated protein
MKSVEDVEFRVVSDGDVAPGLPPPRALPRSMPQPSTEERWMPRSWQLLLALVCLGLLAVGGGGWYVVQHTRVDAVHQAVWHDIQATVAKAESAPKQGAVSAQSSQLDDGTPSPASLKPTPAAALAECEVRFVQLLAERKIEFEKNQAKILDASQGLLDRMAANAKNCPGRIEVQVHTDPGGDATMNRALTQARAEVIRKALMARGVDAQRLVAVGMSADQPIADNSTPEGRIKNRRVELRVLAATQR